MYSFLLFLKVCCDMLSRGDDMKVYLDQLWLINFFVDYLLLRVSGSFAGSPLRWKRVFASALLGGIYGVVCVLPGFSILGRSIYSAIMSVMMCGLAFGFSALLIRITLIYWMLTAAFGGLVVFLTEIFRIPSAMIGKRIYYPVSFPVLILTAGVSYGVISWVLSRLEHHGGDIIPVELFMANRWISLTALRDTGNTLKDPLSGVPVLVTDLGVLKRLIPGGISDGKSPEEIVEKLFLLYPELKPRLIPYKSVGVSSGLLPALRPEMVKISGMEENCLVAFSSVKLSDGGGYEAIYGGKIV